MTVADLMHSIVNSGFAVGLGVAMLPLIFGAASFFTRHSGNRVLLTR